MSISNRLTQRHDVRHYSLSFKSPEVRAHAAEWHVDPKKVGVIGFSAGGFLVAQTSNIFQSTYAPTDAADTLSSRPDFAIAAYPGHLCRDGTFAPGFKVTARTTPTFLIWCSFLRVAPRCGQ